MTRTYARVSHPVTTSITVGPPLRSVGSTCRQVTCRSLHFSSGQPRRGESSRMNLLKESSARRHSQASSSLRCCRDLHTELLFNGSLVEVEERHTLRTNARASPPVRRDQGTSTQPEQFVARVMLIIIGRWHITTPLMAKLRT